MVKQGEVVVGRRRGLEFDLASIFAGST